MKRFIAGLSAVIAASSLLMVASMSGVTAAQSSGMGTATLTFGDQDGSPTFTENFNPFSPVSLEGYDFVYEPLIAIGGLLGNPVPMLATGDKWTNGNKTLVFTLRQGVKYSNGQPFSAQDVVATFNLLKKYPALDTNGIWKEITGVSASGDTVSFNFKSVDIPFAQYIEQTAIIDPAQFTGVNPVTFTDTDPIGTGPYVLDQFTPQAYTMKKNPLYWDASQIKVPEIKEIALTSNTTSDLELSEGMFGHAVLFEPGIQQAYVAKDPSAYHYYFPLASPVNIYFNLTEAPFNNVKFRQAVAYAVNRQQIYTKGEYGYEPPANESLLPPALYGSWLDKSLAKQYAYNYNPKKAEQLLESIGYKMENGKMIGANGQQLGFTLEVPTGWTDWIADTQIIKQELGNIGINVTTETPSVNTDYTQIDTGHFQAALSFGWQEFNPYFVYYYILSANDSAPIGTAVGGINDNAERYNNPTVTNLINELAATANVAKQHQIVDEIQKYTFEDVPVVSLVSAASWNEYQTNEYTGWPTASNPYANPSTTWPNPEIIMQHLVPVTK